MKNYCGADCENCKFRKECKGCCETCGSPFGGKCIAAEYIKVGGIDAYKQFKEKIKEEINALLKAEMLPAADDLFELAGSFVNLEFMLPSGKKTAFLDDRNIYLGAQIEAAVPGVCYGVIADATFILICSYGEGGSDPELILYKKR